jgi:hypothetical protein
MFTEVQTILFLSVFAFLIELVSFLIDRFVLNPQVTLEERYCSAEAARIRQECKKYEAPSTFVQYAKMGREANALEIKATSLQNKREDRKKSPLGKILGFVSSYGLLLLSFCVAYLFTCEASILNLPSPWIWPLNHFLALPNMPPNGSIGSFGWMFVCRRVFSQRVLALFQ